MFVPFAFVNQPVPTQPAVISSGPVGTTFSFTTGTLFDAYTSQAGITSTDAFNTNNGAWQLFYAHQSVSVPLGADNIGLNPHTGGTNSWAWNFAKSNSVDTIGDWSAVTTFTATRSGTYIGGTFTSSTVTTALSIPANTYFLLSNTQGPFYRTIKSLASNRTGTVGGNPYVTVINRVCLGNWPSGGTTIIPTQFGGAGTGYTEYSTHVHVMSVKFT